MRFTAVQEQPEIPKRKAFCGIHREMNCLGCNRHSCTARPGARVGQCVVVHFLLTSAPNSAKVSKMSCYEYKGYKRQYPTTQSPTQQHNEP